MRLVRTKSSSSIITHHYSREREGSGASAANALPLGTAAVASSASNVIPVEQTWRRRKCRPYSFDKEGKMRTPPLSPVSRCAGLIVATLEAVVERRGRGEGWEGRGGEGSGVEWRRRRWQWRWWGAARFPPRLSLPPHPSGIAVILQTECHALQTADKRDRYHSRLLKEGQRWEREEGEEEKKGGGTADGEQKSQIRRARQTRV